MNLFSFNIPVYFVFMGMAWGVAHELSTVIMNQQKISTKGFLTIFLATFFSSWFGSKLFFLIISSGDNFITYL